MFDTKKHLELHEKRMQNLKKEHQRKIRNIIVGRKPRRPWWMLF